MKKEKAIKKEMEVIKAKVELAEVAEGNGWCKVTKSETLEYYVPAELKDEIEVKAYIERHAIIDNICVLKIYELTPVRVQATMNVYDFLHSPLTKIIEK